MLAAEWYTLHLSMSRKDKWQLSLIVRRHHSKCELYTFPHCTSLVQSEMSLHEVHYVLPNTLLYSQAWGQQSAVQMAKDHYLPFVNLPGDTRYFTDRKDLPPKTSHQRPPIKDLPSKTFHQRPPIKDTKYPIACVMCATVHVQRTLNCEVWFSKAAKMT